MEDIQYKKCKHCGKMFYRLCFNDYVYKIKSNYFCSYNCMLAYEKKVESKKGGQ